MNLDSSRSVTSIPTDLVSDPSSGVGTPQFASELSESDIDIEGALDEIPIHKHTFSQDDTTGSYRNRSQSQVDTFEADSETVPKICRRNHQYMEIDWKSPAKVLQWMRIRVALRIVLYL